MTTTRTVVESLVTERVRHKFPFQALLIGDDGLLTFGRHAIARAARHGITAEGDVASMALVMVLLGSELDEDPLLPWAAALLAEPRATPRDRAAQLLAAALDFADQTAGCHNEALGAALGRIRRHPFMTATPPTAPSDWLALLEGLHPERASAMPRDQLVALSERARDMALGYELNEPRAAAMLGVCLFELGVRFDRDPLFPWASAALHGRADDENIAPDRLFRFYAAAMLYVERLLSAVNLRR